MSNPWNNRVFQVIDIVGFYDRDFLNFASPPKIPDPTTFAIIKPLSLYVWIGGVASMISTALAMWMMSRAESKVVGISLADWESYGKSLWYCFGTVIGESLTRDTSSEGAWAIRL